MEIDDHIEKSEEGLEQLIEAAMMFEENHYLEAVRLKKMSEFDILTLTEDVRLWYSRMRKESLKLAAFSEHFLDEFATDNNRRFRDAYDLFSRIRSTISGSRKVFRKFCRRMMRNPINPAADNSVLGRSVLSAHAVGRDIFGIGSYDEKVCTLYEELKAFFTTLIVTLSLCHRMIRDEDAIKKDGARCLEIYKKCRKEILSSARLFAKTFNVNIQQVSSQEYIERRKKAKSMQEYAQKDYHQRSKCEFMTVVAFEVIAEGNSQGLSDEESLLWPNNLEKVKQVRNAIRRLDDMVAPEHKNIDGKFLLEFIKWCGVSCHHERKLYNYLLDNYKGSKHIVGWTQVLNTRKDYGNLFSDEQLAQAFAQRLDLLAKSAA